MNTSFAEALRPVAARMPRVVREHEVLRVAGWMPGEDPNAVARKAAGEVLRWAQRRAGQRFPREAWGGESFELPLPGRDPSAIRLRAGTSDLWAFRVHDPDKNVPGRAWTTEVVLGHLPGKPAQFSTRLLVATPEENFSIDPAVPGFVQQIAGKCHLMVGSQAASATPEVYVDGEDAEALIEHLTDPGRQLPTIVLTLAEGASAPYINAEKLAGVLTGLAHVAVARPDAAWRLTERLGKRLSVFGGATRVYQPDFKDTADPFAHRLVLSGQLVSVDGVERATRWLRESAAQACLQRTRLGVDVVAFSAIRAGQLEVQQLNLREADASDADQLVAALKRIEALKGEVEDLKTEQTYYIEEFDKERERAELAEAQAQKSAYRIQQLTDQLKSKGDDPDQEIQLPTDWSEFASWCEEKLAGRLVLTPNAYRGTRKPLFQDVETAARSLLWLATEGRDRFREGGGALANISIFDGVQNAPCGADAFDFDWNSRRFSAEWHIKNGGNTRDPIRCLRIYYCFDPQTQQIVVSDMPAHRRTGTT
ncbi:cell division protein FtsB [Ochrobactrum sp. RH1CCR137]|nr:MULTISPECIES: hypothetical protein [unclassified Ochrobactrum]MBA8843467.1 cell division protein FtsB [Ochrobactrum sp. RH1CCR137]MBA8855655.1 cell division protein FtsB [Ochrobactrum sp. RH1CCR134]